MLIGIDPHKASHTAEAVDDKETAARRAHHARRSALGGSGCSSGWRSSPRDSGPSSRATGCDTSGTAAPLPAGEDVVDVPPTPAAHVCTGVRQVAEVRAQRRAVDSDSRTSGTEAQRRHPRRAVRSCGFWPSATTTSDRSDPGHRLAPCPHPLRRHPLCRRCWDGCTADGGTGGHRASQGAQALPNPSANAWIIDRWLTDGASTHRSPTPRLALSERFGRRACRWVLGSTESAPAHGSPVRGSLGGVWCVVIRFGVGPE